MHDGGPAGPSGPASPAQPTAEVVTLFPTTSPPSCAPPANGRRAGFTLEDVRRWAEESERDGTPGGDPGDSEECVFVDAVRADGSFGAEFGPIAGEDGPPYDERLPDRPVTLPVTPAGPRLLGCAACGTQLQAERGICLGCTKHLTGAMLERLRGRISCEAFAEVQEVWLAPTSTSN